MLLFLHEFGSLISFSSWYDWFNSNADVYFLSSSNTCYFFSFYSNLSSVNLSFLSSRNSKKKLIDAEIRLFINTDAIRDERRVERRSESDFLLHWFHGDRDEFESKKGFLIVANDRRVNAMEIRCLFISHVQDEIERKVVLHSISILNNTIIIFHFDRSIDRIFAQWHKINIDLRCASERCFFDKDDCWIIVDLTEHLLWLEIISMIDSWKRKSSFFSIVTVAIVCRVPHAIE